MTAATIAALAFFVCSLIAAASVAPALRAFGEGTGTNPWALATLPALFAMLYALILYQNAERKIRRLGESVSRGILVMLMTWVSIATLITLAWYHPGEFVSGLVSTLQTSGLIGGGPMLLDAVGAGTLAGVFILRRPPPRIG
jgi:hypothetical protein